MIGTGPAGPHAAAQHMRPGQENMSGAATGLCHCWRPLVAATGCLPFVQWSLLVERSIGPVVSVHHALDCCRTKLSFSVFFFLSRGDLESHEMRLQMKPEAWSFKSKRKRKKARKCMTDKCTNKKSSHIQQDHCCSKAHFHRVQCPSFAPTTAGVERIPVLHPPQCTKRSTGCLVGVDAPSIGSQLTYMQCMCQMHSRSVFLLVCWIVQTSVQNPHKQYNTYAPTLLVQPCPSQPSPCG